MVLTTLAMDLDENLATSTFIFLEEQIMNLCNKKKKPKISTWISSKNLQNVLHKSIIAKVWEIDLQSQ